MCEAVSAFMATYGSQIAAGAAIASAATTAYSYDQQGKYQKKVGENNALSAEFAAKDALARGMVEEDKARDRARALIGKQKAALSANGIDFSTGVGGNILSDTAAMAEFDTLTVRNNAMKQAYGFKTQSDNLLSEGRAARIGGNNAAVGSLLTGGSQATSYYTRRS